MIPDGRIATFFVATVLASGCWEQNTQELAKDAQQASGEVAEEQKDVRKAGEQLE